MSDVQVVAGYREEILECWTTLEKKFKECQFFFYKDDMDEKDYKLYPPAIQSFLLEKHFKENPELSEQAIFFHDADFLFTKPMSFEPYLNDDTWYFSDTIDYIGADYIKSKDDSLLDIMCQIVGIPRNIVEDNQKKSGGAQKLMKNVTSEYWTKVHKDSLELYRTLSKLQHLKKEGDPNGIQAWTASMWAELWNAWYFGHKVEVPKEFDFCWATCPINKWESLNFFHNAGVVSAKSKMFYKGDYIDRFPFDDELDINDNRCSYNYYKEIKSVKF